ncbi:hypothetical protein UK23_45185 [Lentzea aerocolonigenes]|uniref:Cytochrome b5 heme-binding domain-containing protein n=1 Tax=Lentzea aerocolonigenes TaxID=68170 RepID=A0A0F0GG92_LENAE|nr:hypothetical protein UK23_45185 [Lentzea aerocolonigenes]
MVLDGRVLDLSGFLEHHPGGTSVLLANLGRDVSADFHHVTAHARAAVTRKLDRQAVAEVAPLTIPPAAKDFARFVDHVRLLLNSFDVQADPARDPIPDLFYVGQLYSHFVGDHLVSLLDTLAETVGVPVEPAASQRLRRVFEAVPGRVEAVVVAADAPAATELSRQMQQRCRVLLDDLLRIGSEALGELRGANVHQITSCHATKMMCLANEWISEEYDLVNAE